MIKLFLPIIVFSFLASCLTSRETESFVYETKEFNFNSSLKLEVLHFRLANKNEAKNGIASLFICKKFKTNELVKVISTCTHSAIKKQTYVRLYDCNQELNDTIYVVSDKDLEKKYVGLPIFFGLLATPVE